MMASLGVFLHEATHKKLTASTNELLAQYENYRLLA